MTATIATWRWQSSESRLEIDAEPGTGWEGLEGKWSLTNLSAVTDGFTRQRLQRAFSQPSAEWDAIRCELTFDDGRRAVLAGRWAAGGEAMGTIAQQAPGPRAALSPMPPLEPVYQPIIRVSDGEIAGFEALARWQGETGLDGRQADLLERGLTSNMLLQAAEALSGWQTSSGRHDLFVQVNLTSRDLEQPELPVLIDALCLGHGLRPGTLRLELTEQAALRDWGQTLPIANALVEAGAILVLDDFGTGHSSFEWLAELPVGGVKVDRSLTAKLDRERYRFVLEGIVFTASRLGASVTVEGVEDALLLEELRRIGVDFVQGFAFHRPLDLTGAGRVLG